MSAVPRAGLWRRRLVLAALIWLCVLVAFAGYRLSTELTVLRDAPRDNVQWTLAQAEVDLLSLRDAVRRADDGKGSLADVRRRFDIFYSRIGTLTRGKVFAVLRAMPGVAEKLAAVRTFLDGTVPLIDGSDAALEAGLGAVGDRLDALRTPVRELSLEGVRLYAIASDAQRENFVDALLTAALILFLLILILGVTLVYLERQSRISLRQAAESNRSRKRLSATINASLDAIVVADGSGRIVDWNGAAEEVFGFSRDQAIGAAMAETIVPERYREAHRRGMERYLTTGEKRVVDGGRVELTGLRADGTEFPVELAIGVSEGEDGPIFISYLRDISKRKAAERALTEARDAAMAADRAKSEFLAVMSHEMRTPLNGVLGVLDLLAGTALNGRQRRYVDVATGSGEILLRHINDVLDITRVEAGKMIFAEEPLDLPALVREAVEVSRPIAEANGAVIAIAPDLPRHPLAGDAHRLRQVLLNLLGNAAKFAGDGRIEVEVTAVEASDTRVDLTFTVDDSGPGIQPEDRERVFEDFVTLDASYHRETSGSGLGLAISRRIIHAMGGEIGVAESPLGGARFWFRLPLTKIASAPPPLTHGGDATAGATAAARVLLVEDNEINRMVVRETLQRAGHAVVEAENGRAGADAAARERFDLILMDISMPVMDGVAATRAIRAGDGASRETPILGLTAHALPAERRRFAEAGMQDCLVKPVRREELLQAVDRLATGRTPAEEIADAADDDGVIDEETLADLAASLPPEVFAATLEKVKRELVTGLAEMHALAAGAKAVGLARTAHKLAGSAAVIGAASVHRHLAEVESQAKAGRCGDAADLLPVLEARIDETNRILSEFAGT